MSIINSIEKKKSSLVFFFVEIHTQKNVPIYCFGAQAKAVTVFFLWLLK